MARHAFPQLFDSRRSADSEYLLQLIRIVTPIKHDSVGQHLRQNAPSCPDIHSCVILGELQAELGGTVVAGDLVGTVRISWTIAFGTSKVSDLQLSCRHVHQQILRFDVTVQETVLLQIHETTERLVDEKLKTIDVISQYYYAYLDVDLWHDLSLVDVFGLFEGDGGRDQLHDQGPHCVFGLGMDTDVVVEKLHQVGMIQFPMNGYLTIFSGWIGPDLLDGYCKNLLLLTFWLHFNGTLVDI